MRKLICAYTLLTLVTPSTSSLQSGFEPGIEITRSVLVREAGTVAIVREFSKRLKQRVRLSPRILIVERQEQISPDFIIE